MLKSLSQGLFLGFFVFLGFLIFLGYPGLAGWLTGRLVVLPARGMAGWLAVCLGWLG